MQSHPILYEPVKTQERSEIVDVTEIVRRLVREQNIRDGMAIIYVPHTTAAVTINENYDPDVKHDLLKKLTKNARAGRRKAITSTMKATATATSKSRWSEAVQQS